MLQRCYAWITSKAAHPHAVYWLTGTSFVESFISPIPPDPLLVPMILFNRSKAWRYAFLCTLASVVGGLIGYYIGMTFFETVGRQILDLYHLNDAFQKLQAFFEAYGFWVILLKGFTPIPFKVVTITCGVTEVDLLTFVTASLLSRGMRFYLEAWLFWKWGAPMQAMVEKNLRWFVIGGTLALIGGYAVIKYLV